MRPVVAPTIIQHAERAQFVEMRERLRAQISAHQKLCTAAMFEDGDTELKQRIDSHIKELEDRITVI
jgi:transposase